MRDLRLSAGATTIARRASALLGLIVMIGAITAAPAPARGHQRGHHHGHRSVWSRYPNTRPTHGTTAHGELLHLVANTNQSSNWSGYNQGALEQGGKLFTSISGDWTVPTATQHTSGQAEYSSDWIGIGGGCVDSGCMATDNTLIQTGTEQDVSSSGAASYSAWWEIIPGPSLTITNMTIHPGDTMTASISQAAPEVWTITISDTKDGQSYTTTVPYSSTEATAEWIQETPLILGTGAGFAALPNLNSPAFDLAKTNGAPANLSSSQEMDLVNSSGSVISAPSGPDPDTDGFNVCAWASTCSPPSSS